MRKLFLIPILTLLAGGAIDQDDLKNYRSQTERTDPGEYSYMFDGLPTDLASLCSIIKQQLLQPQEATVMGLSIEEILKISWFLHAIIIPSYLLPSSGIREYLYV